MLLYYLRETTINGPIETGESAGSLSPLLTRSTLAKIGTYQLLYFDYFNFNLF